MNLTLKDSDWLKLIDFGFSKVWAANTQMAESCGTLAYIAPEVSTIVIWALVWPESRDASHDSKSVFVRGLLGTGPPDPTLESASPSPNLAPK